MIARPGLVKMMSKSTTSTSTTFEVPECLRKDAKWRGDVVLRATTTGAGGAIETVHFYCHTAILCLHCPFFDAALSGPWKESQVQMDTAAAATATATDTDTGWIRVIEMQDEDASLIRDLLCFWYPNLTLKVTKDNWKELSRLADKLDVPELEKRCCAYGEKIAAHDPLDVLNWAAMRGYRDPFLFTSELVLKDFKWYKSQDGYRNLPFSVQNLLEAANSAWMSRCMREVHRLHKRIASVCPVADIKVKGARLSDVEGALERLVTYQRRQDVELLVNAVSALEKSVPFIGSMRLAFWTLMNYVPIKWDHAERCAVIVQEHS